MNVVKISSIAVEMEKSGLDDRFIDRITKLAHIDSTIFVLMEKWYGADNENDRDKIISDIQRSSLRSMRKCRL